MHKKAFSLESGKCLSGEEYAVKVFPVKVEGNDVYVQVPIAQDKEHAGACCVPVHHFEESGEARCCHVWCPDFSATVRPSVPSRKRASSRSSTCSCGSSRRRPSSAFRVRTKKKPLHCKPRYYRDLIPLNAPKEGEQYAFEVDLDSCTGCKACVTACHNLNGLDEDEVWRKVGPALRRQQPASGDPARLDGLPPLRRTGLHGGLPGAGLRKGPGHGHRPAPRRPVHRLPVLRAEVSLRRAPLQQENGDRAEVRHVQQPSGGGRGPGLRAGLSQRGHSHRGREQGSGVGQGRGQPLPARRPEPGYTKPATIYKTQKKLPANLLPADYWSVAPQHGHLPLVFMLVLTQMSAGAFLVERVLAACFPHGFEGAARSIHITHVVAVARDRAARAECGDLSSRPAAVRLSGLHRAEDLMAEPRNRCLRRLRRTGIRLRRGGLRCCSSAGRSLRRSSSSPAAPLRWRASSASFVPSKIYADTRRPFWDVLISGPKFFATALVLGLPVALSVALAATLFSNAGELHAMMTAYGRLLCAGPLGITAAKLAFEALIFVWLLRRQPTPLKRTALLMTGELRKVTMLRFVCGALGGLLLPAVLLMEDRVTSTGYPAALIAIVAILIVVLLLAGELLERYLFFAAVVAPKMPGSPAS